MNITGVSKLKIGFMNKEDKYNNIPGAMYFTRYLVNIFLYNNLFLILGSIIYLLLSWFFIGMSKYTSFGVFPCAM